MLEKYYELRYNAGEGRVTRMRKAAVCVALLFLAIVLPSLSFTEDQETVLLARAVYAVARDESYETKLAVASAALNRVDDPGACWRKSISSPSAAITTPKASAPPTRRSPDAAICPRA